MKESFEVGDIVFYTYEYNNIHHLPIRKNPYGYYLDTIFDGRRPYKCMILKDNNDGTFVICNMMSKFLDVVEDANPKIMRFIADKKSNRFIDELFLISADRASIYNDYVNIDYVCLLRELERKEENKDLSMILTKSLNSLKVFDYYNIKSMDEALDLINLININYKISGDERLIDAKDDVIQHIKNMKRVGKLKWIGVFKWIIILYITFTAICRIQQQVRELIQLLNITTISIEHLS